MKPAKTPKSRKSALIPNELLQILKDEMEQEKSGPEGEKWVMPDEPASRMADTSVERVALVAANLSRNDLPSHECVIKAYEILHWASVAHGYLHGNPHPRINGWTTLVSDYIRREQSGETVSVEESAMSFVKWDEQGKPKPIAFVKALEAIDPKGDRTQRRKERIKDWLVSLQFVKTTQEAEKKIEKWRVNGEVPFMDFDHAFYSFRIWMREKTSSQNAEKVEKLQKDKAEQKPISRTKRKRKPKASDTRKRPKHSGITGKGRSENHMVQNISKKVLDRFS
jgi:hypothetical protein